MKVLHCFKLCLVPALIILFAGCSKPAHVDYQELVNTQHGPIYKTHERAIESATPTALTLGEMNIVPLRLNDPVMELEGSLSPFKVLKTETLSVGTYEISVDSRCDGCRGFNRSMPLPYIVLYDDQAQVIPSIKQADGRFATLVFRMYFNVTRETDVTLLVAADNRQLGNSVQAFVQPYQSKSIQLPVAIFYGPQGNIVLKMTKVE